jgi:hypothetical protein
VCEREREPEGSTSYTSIDTPGITDIFTITTVFMVKRDWAYPQLGVNDQIVTAGQFSGSRKLKEA